jgi:predicted acetyltransferase
VTGRFGVRGLPGCNRLAAAVFMMVDSAAMADLAAVLSDHVPPHRAEPTLHTVTSEQELEVLSRAVARGFHSEYRADDFAAERPLLELDRCFGFRAGDRWIATALSMARQMTVPGGTVPAAAVTAVTVAPGYRRRGLLTQMMRHQLTEIAERGTEPLALLWASESPIYGRFGYGQATRRLELSGPTRQTAFLPDVDLGNGSTDEVDRDEFLAIAPALRSTILAERPGHLDRNEPGWTMALYDPEHDRNGAGPLRFAVHYGQDGSPDGFATFRIGRDNTEGRQVQIGDLDATTPPAYAALWRWLLDLDLVRAFRREVAPVDEPLLHWVADPRQIKTLLSDASYARIVDVVTALRARAYAAELEAVLEIDDRFLPELGGRFRITAGPDGAEVSRTDHTPDLTLTARQLASIYLGGTTASGLARAGSVTEHTPGAVRAVTAAFGWDRAPYCPDFF